jgi:hypothetical protein
MVIFEGAGMGDMEAIGDHGCGKANVGGDFKNTPL